MSIFRGVENSEVNSSQQRSEVDFGSVEDVPSTGSETLKPSAIETWFFFSHNTRLDVSTQTA